MLLYFYVARTYTHTVSLVIFTYRFFLKKKKKFLCGTKICPINLNTAVTKQKLGVEASSAGKGPLEGKPKKTISALTSWEGKGVEMESAFPTMT